MTRQSIFISHARPENNGFVHWLGEVALDRVSVDQGLRAEVADLRRPRGAQSALDRDSRGVADFKQVMADVLALTKLNYNACIFGGGVPVTRRFADAVGEILTASRRKNELPPLPFRCYI
jgi:hypothetical protein